MLHYLDDPERYALPDRPLPAFFNVGSPEDIAAALAAHDRASLKSVGAEAADWYDRYQGRALAAEYLALLEQVAGRRVSGRAA